MASFGIDLGTTYSCIAKYDNHFGRVEVVNNSEGLHTTPSVVYIENGENIVVGTTALNQLRGKNAPNVVAFAKRLIADDNLFERNEFNNYPHWNGKSTTPLEISSMILKKLTVNNENVQNIAKGETINAVITFPAYFSLGARERTKKAGEIIGLNIIGMIEEPIAAAISYGFGESIKDEVVMVYDLGGGTFDVSVLKFDSAGNGQVLAKEGNPRLGGVDWDNVFGFYIWNKYDEENSQDIKLTLDDFKSTEISDVNKLRKVNAFRLYAQTAKHELTQKTECDIECDIEGTTVKVTRDDFERETRVFLDITLGLTDKVIGLVSDPISAVLLVGGSSRMPQVFSALEKTFPQFRGKIRLEDPDQAVAKGAAIYAASKSGETALPPVIKITNIASKSYGIEVCKLDGNDKVIGTYVSNIIRKGEPLPANASEEYSTIGNGQTRMSIKVYESDSDDENISLDKAKKISDAADVKFERAVPKGTGVVVQFELSDSGLLHIKANSLVDHGNLDFVLELKGVMTGAQINEAKSLLKKA